MSFWSKYEIIVMSKAEYDHDGVGYSTVHDDEPLVLGADAIYDTQEIQMRPWGRDPSGAPLFVNETVTRWTSAVTQHGITSSSDSFTPPLGYDPAVSILRVVTSNSGSIGTIDAYGKHFVLGVNPTDKLGDPIPPALEPYAWDVAILEPRWLELRDGMIFLGMDPVKIDAWRANNPNATPLDIEQAFKNFVTNAMEEE